MTPRTGQLVAFVLLAYLLVWALLAPWFYAVTVLHHGTMTPWLWVLTPLAFVGGWAPTTAALIVTARTSGREGVRRLLGSLARWRVPVRWYAVTFALPPLIIVASLIVTDQGFDTLGRFNLARALARAPLAYLVALPFGPLGEELGWRGFALPRLLSRFGPAGASLILGVLWTFWHVPMMLWFPGASIPSFLPLSVASVALYLVEITAETVLITYLFIRTNGSVLMTVLAHLALNTATAVVLGGLPALSMASRMTLYEVHVALLALLGAATLVWFVREGKAAGSPALH